MDKSYVAKAKSIQKKIVPTILIHGGAGTLKNVHRMNLFFAIKTALMLGYRKLIKTEDSMEAVLAAVKSMELDRSLNAGFGSSLTCTGTVEMDAAVMNGTNLECGCVSGVRNLLNPVLLAHRVLKCRHNFLSGEGAMGFAKHQGFEFVQEEDLMTSRTVADLAAYYRSVDPQLAVPVDESWPEYQCDVNDTVGAIAVDDQGRMAVAASSGGTTGKICGRIGSAPIIGSGTYANDKIGAISVSGNGEGIIRNNIGTQILSLIQLAGMTPKEAINKVLLQMNKATGERAGAICIDKKGRIGVDFTTKRMIWAYQRARTHFHCGLEIGEDLKEHFLYCPTTDELMCNKKWPEKQ